MSSANDEGSDCDKAKFKDLCRELNMDERTELTAWQMYEEVSKRTSLEGNPVHWFCCALYVACRQSCVPTVGGEDTVVVGNCISLNKLLRSCSTSIFSFITSIKNWHEMANLPQSFLNQIERLERNFSISINLFQHYDNIFQHLFLSPRNEKKNTKYRSVTKCSSNKLYDMCWCLYLCAKNDNPKYTGDLVTSFHLLICCIDLIYRNVLAENRIDLINTEFKGTPDNWNTPDFEVKTLAGHCIIEPLCELTGAVTNAAKAMKRSSWNVIIQKFFETKTISGNQHTFLEIISNTYFEGNFKSLKDVYEQYVLSVGELDETIFLSNPNYRKVNSSDYSNDIKVEHIQNIKSLIPDTPYTRKHSLPSKEAVSEPIANATNNVKKLLEIRHLTEPTEFIRQCGDDVVNKLDGKLNKMYEIFYSKYPFTSEANERFLLTKSLCYYLFENIIHVEVKKSNMDLKSLLGSDIFITTLIACCFEIVLDAYNSDLKFPWILDCFSIKAFHFTKIIELVVLRHDGIFTRSLIKHLNYIEETCLESLAWQRTSPVWDTIKSQPKPLPTWADVDVSNMATKMESSATQSPMNTAYESFSTTTTTVSDSVRKDLFNSDKDKVTTTENTKKPNLGNKRAGPLQIFLRKFYKLAWVRIKELCNDLGIYNENILKKIWTLFEYSITQKTELMQDRHLDQIFMCAIYLYIKVGEIQGKTFTDIMKFYRKQPQATSSTYREIIIDNNDLNNEESEETPGICKKDIIYFYNYIYVKKMTPYALNFSEKKKSRIDLLLSPHPSEKQTFPIKPSSNHRFFVHQMEKTDASYCSKNYTYEFCKSPGKDLENINKLVRGKRPLSFTDESLTIDRKIPRVENNLKKVKEMIKDRQDMK